MVEAIQTGIERVGMIEMIKDVVGSVLLVVEIYLGCVLLKMFYFY